MQDSSEPLPTKIPWKLKEKNDYTAFPKHFTTGPTSSSRSPEEDTNLYTTA